MSDSPARKKQNRDFSITQGKPGTDQIRVKYALTDAAEATVMAPSDWVFASGCRGKAVRDISTILAIEGFETFFSNHFLISCSSPSSCDLPSDSLG